MGTYLDDFRREGPEAASEIGSCGRLCPFLFYNLLPYVFVIGKGGWFDWVVRRRSSYRRPPRQKDAKNKAVNRLYPNEVLVRCPNPDACVTAGVGPWGRKEIKIRILFGDERCPNQHYPLEEFILDAEEGAAQALRFNSFFPRHLLSAFAAKESKGQDDLLRADRDMKIEAAHVIFPCRYHAGKAQFQAPFLAQGFCLHLFQALYPFILGKMYHAHIGTGIAVTCPQGGCEVSVRIEKIRRIKNSIAASVFEWLKKACAFILYPPDIIDYDLNIQVERIRNKHPGCTLREGNPYPVNLRSRKYVCPAALHVLYPYLLLKHASHSLSWLKGSKGLVACPDCVGILYR